MNFAIRKVLSVSCSGYFNNFNRADYSKSRHLKPERHSAGPSEEVNRVKSRRITWYVRDFHEYTVLIVFLQESLGYCAIPAEFWFLWSYCFQAL
jgi:hypothetical protein